MIYKWNKNENYKIKQSSWHDCNLSLIVDRLQACQNNLF